MGSPLESGDIIQKIRHYCTYQERYIREVQDKLKSWAVQKQQIPVIINQLQKEGFLNEERFAKAFAGGKFRLNKWGRQKIEFELKLRGLPELLIEEGLFEIDEEEYREVLKELISRKYQEIKHEKTVNIREKIINFAYMKGYEMSLILALIKELQI
jgi:regulatory protein